MRKTAVILLALLVAPLFAKTLVDALNHTVVIEHYPPKKVVALTPALAETVCLLNCKLLVGVVTPVTWPPQLVKLVKEHKVEVVGSFWAPNLEKVSSLKPDLILADAGSDLRLYPKLKSLGYPVFYVKGGICGTVKCVAHDILLVGNATGEYEKAKVVAGWVLNNLTKAEKVASNFTKAKVVMLFYPFTWGVWAVGQGNFINDIVSHLNAVNLIKEKGYPRIPKEVLYKLKPDVVILLGYGKLDPAKVIKQAKDLIKGAKWACVIYSEDADVVQRPGPRLSQAPWVLLKAIHEHSSDSHGLYCQRLEHG